MNGRLFGRRVAESIAKERNETKRYATESLSAAGQSAEGGSSAKEVEKIYQRRTK